MKLIYPFLKLKRKWNVFIKKQLRKVGIFPRLIISFMLLLLFTSLFLTFFTFYQYSTELNRNINRYTALLVQNVSLEIEDKMKEYEDIALRFYNDPQVIQALVENSGHSDKTLYPQQYDQNTFIIENKLYNLRSNRKYIANIQFVTPDRQYRMVEQNGFGRGGLIRDLDAFYETDFYRLPQEKNGYPIWIDGHNQSHIFFRDEQSVYGLGNIITMAVSVYEPSDRQFLGVLLFNIDLNAFSDCIRDYHSYSYEGGNTFLVGEGGVLSWYAPSISAPSFPQNTKLFEQMLSGDQDVLHIKTGGQPLLLSYQRIRDTGLFVSYIADLDLLLKNSYHIRNLCLIVLTATVIAGFIIAYYVTVSISDPVRQLIRVMHKTADGKWTARYENSGHDEISILGDNFNDMAEKTNQLIDQVYVSEIRRQKMLLSWKNAQLSAMLMQINPHFLYNCLSLINSRALLTHQNDISQMSQLMSTFYRTTLNKGNSMTLLRDEIRNVMSYLEIQRLLHDNRFQVITQIDPILPEISVPNLLLQPLVENSIVHGLLPRQSGDGCLFLTIRRVDNAIHFNVMDNGVGIEPEKIASLTSTDSSGYGLKNVNERLLLTYGEESCLKIKSIQNESTMITFFIPFSDPPSSSKTEGPAAK